MKRKILSVCLFLVIFAAVYALLCYFPPLRIKLAAGPMEYFRESIRHGVPFKMLVSAIAGLLAGSVPLIAARRRDRKAG